MHILNEVDKIQNSPVFESNTSLWEFCLKASSPQGLFLEFGVWQGYSINFMSSLYPDITFYGFDSFEGLPEFWREGYDKGTFKLDKIPEVNNNVQIITGLFQESLPGFLELHTGPLSFCHIDCDLYSSSKFVLHSLKHRMQKGSILLFDELYNYPGYEKGELKALLEFANEFNIQYEYIGFNINHEQVALKLT